VREALVAGRGIAPAHRWLVDHLLASGRVEAILPDYKLDIAALQQAYDDAYEPRVRRY